MPVGSAAATACVLPLAQAHPGCSRVHTTFRSARSMLSDLFTMLRADLDARYAYPPPLWLSATEPTCASKGSAGWG